MTNQMISIIGLGKLGQVLATAWVRAGYDIDCVPRSSLETLGSVIVLTTQDQHIESLARNLAQAGTIKPGSIVIHCSGALSSEILSPLRACGAHIASCHPLQTFPDLESGLAALPGTFWFCEGDAEALDRMKLLIESIQGQMQTIQPTQKMAYHAAVCIAANYMTSLIGAAEMIGSKIGLAPSQFRLALAPILKTTLDNGIRKGAVDSLTGPVARNDVQTLQHHREELEKLFANDNDLTNLYHVLAEFTKNHIAPKK